MQIEYKNYYFDFAADIKEELAAMKTVPEAADINITASNALGSTGVVLVAKYGEEEPRDFYLNAYVAGAAVTLTAVDGAKIVSATSSVEGSDIAVAADGACATFTPATIKIVPGGKVTDEIITVTMDSGEEYAVHTASEMIPLLKLAGNGVSADDFGIYTFENMMKLIRINSDRELVYFRDVTCLAPMASFNFEADEASGKLYLAYDVPISQKMYGGGYNSAVYVVMDENYREIDVVGMLPNDDPNHTHGEGYIDQHEHRMLGDKHYLTLSYTPLEVDNLPEGVEGIDGTSRAYVWACIFQEIWDGKVISEINTTDYPELYASAVEGCDFAATTGEYDKPRSWADYIHANSLDYILAEDGTVQKIVVSMRDQSALFQFDMKSGEMEWVLGGLASTLTGFEDYTIPRKSDKGVDFNAIMFGQHYARYKKFNDDGTYELTVLDNFTGAGLPFMYETGTYTRAFKFLVDEEAKTAKVLSCINGRDIDYITGRDHTGDHCASVDYWSDTSVNIGWGLHMPVDLGLPIAAEYGWQQGDHSIFTDYNPVTGTVSLELNLLPSEAYQKKVADGFDFGRWTMCCGAYRAYKTMR